MIKPLTYAVDKCVFCAQRKPQKSHSTVNISVFNNFPPSQTQFFHNINPSPPRPEKTLTSALSIPE